MKNTSRKPYIYKVTNLETGQYYIGSQCSGKTVGVNYFTSSWNKAFKEGFKNYGEEKYKIEIIKEFEDPEECVRAENYLIWDHLQLKDGLCLNKACCCGGKKIFSTVGTHLSEKTKQKIGIARTGIPLSEETRKKMSAVKKGIHPSEETRKRISEALKGRSLSEEAKKKLREASKRRKKISIENNIFDSLVVASKYYNVSLSLISYWLKTKNHNAVYIEK